LTSITSLRFMASAIRDVGGSEDFQDFASMLSVASPCRLSSPTKGSSSPTRAWDKRGSASFLSDILHLHSPDKKNARRTGLFSRSSLLYSPGQSLEDDQQHASTDDCAALSSLPPVDESEGCSSTPCAPRKAPYPALFSMATPIEKSANVAESRLLEKEREIRSLQEELANRKAEEMSLRERENGIGLREHLLEERVRDMGRSMAAQEKQLQNRENGIVEREQAANAEQVRAVTFREQLLGEIRRAFEVQQLRLSSEREDMEAERRSFLLHSIAEADAELMRREEKLREHDTNVVILKARITELEKEKGNWIEATAFWRRLGVALIVMVIGVLGFLYIASEPCTCGTTAPSIQCSAKADAVPIADISNMSDLVEVNRSQYPPVYFDSTTMPTTSDKPLPEDTGTAYTWVSTGLAVLAYLTFP